MYFFAARLPSPIPPNLNRIHYLTIIYECDVCTCFKGGVTGDSTQQHLSPQHCLPCNSGTRQLSAQHCSPCNTWQKTATFPATFHMTVLRGTLLWCVVPCNTALMNIQGKRMRKHKLWICNLHSDAGSYPFHGNKKNLLWDFWLGSLFCDKVRWYSIITSNSRFF